MIQIDHDQIIRKAFKHVLAQGPPSIGDIIGELDSDDSLSYKLVDIQGDVATGELPNGNTKKFSLDHIADVNAVQRVALQIKQGGYH